MGRLRSKKKAKQREQQQKHGQTVDDHHSNSTIQESVVGVHGVRLKHFERVLASLLQKMEPIYVKLPPLPTQTGECAIASDSIINNINNNNNDWPFSTLPSTARVLGDAPGQLKHPKRASRKEAQLQSMLRCIMPLVPEDHRKRGDAIAAVADDDDAIFTIVDFGGGSGHLAIPLALLLQMCRVVVVDFNQHSLKLMQTKAEQVIQQLEAQSNEEQLKYTPTKTASTHPYAIDQNDTRFWSCGQCYQSSTSSSASITTDTPTILGNLFAFQGPVEEFTASFDMALALHLCGEATDVAIRKAIISNQAAAIVMAPCCVGKLSQKAFNPDVFNATGRNDRAVSYPQSTLFCQLVGKDDTSVDKESDRIKREEDAPQHSRRQKDDWDSLAKAADYSNEQECGTSRNATRRSAKALLETDRRLFIEEHKVSNDSDYRTALMRMEPLDATPKNDILVAWRKDVYGESVKQLFSIPNPECQEDIRVAKSHLLMGQAPDDGSSMAATKSMNTTGRSDWTPEEEEEIKRLLLDFLDRTKDMEDFMDQVFLFPTRMGGRKRKLIHFVAGKMDLVHWSHGSKDSEKTVAVARRGQRKRRQDEAENNAAKTKTRSLD